MTKYILAVLIVATLTGCGTYQNPKVADFAPDSMNFTEQVDNRSGDTSEYVGFSWDLHKKGADAKP